MLNSGDAQPGAKNGPMSSLNTAGRRAGTAVAVAACAAMLAGGLALTPSVAQLKPSDPGVETPFGRAPLTFADILDKVKPSVVSISVTGSAQTAQRGGPGGQQSPFPDIPEDSPFYEFFKNLPREFRNAPQPRPSQAQGSGFVISEDGYVVTNNHVIDGAGRIQVSFDDQEKLEAELVGTDARTDLALLKIKAEGKKFVHVPFSEEPARVGDWALAVGNPFGLGGTVTAGIVSALSRDIGSGPYDFLQIDAAVNRGNSGGPTFNLKGEVIGVNTAIFSPSGGNVGIAFAVPARTAVEVIEQLRQQGTVSRGWLGVKIQNVDEDTAAALGLDSPKGALVSELTPGGPAAGSGLQVQDAILQVNTDEIADSRDLARKIAGYAPDTTVDVKVWRGNKEETVKVKLGTFPRSADEIARLEQGKPMTTDPTGVELDQLGLTLAPIRGGQEGIPVAEVDPESDAAQKGIRAGDVILGISGTTVREANDIVEAIRKANDLDRGAVMLSIKRESEENPRILPVQLKKS